MIAQGRAAARVSVIRQEEDFLHDVAPVYFDAVIAIEPEITVVALDQVSPHVVLVRFKRLVEAEAHEGKVPFAQFHAVRRFFSRNVRRPYRHEGHSFDAAVADGKDVHDIFPRAFIGKVIDVGIGVAQDGIGQAVLAQQHFCRIFQADIPADEDVRPRRQEHRFCPGNDGFPVPGTVAQAVRRLVAEDEAHLQVLVVVLHGRIMGTARKLRRRPEDAFDLGRAVAMMDTANIEIAGLQRRDRQRIQGVEEDAVIIRRYMGRLFFTIFAVFIGFIRFFIHLAVFVACPVWLWQP